MKITAVRLIKYKDPVGVFGGWMSDSSLDLNLIRECMNPPECEFLETEISKEAFGIIWPKIRKDGETIPSDMKFTLKLNLDILDIFTVGYFQWEKFADLQENQSMDKIIEGLNNEIEYLNALLARKDKSIYFVSTFNSRLWPK